MMETLVYFLSALSVIFCFSFNTYMLTKYLKQRRR